VQVMRMFSFSSAIKRLVDSNSLGATAEKNIHYLTGKTYEERTLLTFAKHLVYSTFH